MKPGTLVRVVRQYAPAEGLVPVWLSPGGVFRGWVHHGDAFLMVKAGLLDGGLQRHVERDGVTAPRWGNCAEIIHPVCGAVLVEGAYLEAVDDPA